MRWIIILFVVACRPTLHMNITVPAQVSIDPAVTKIAVVDRVSNEYTRRAISGFIEAAQQAQTVRFQVIDGQQLYNNLAVPVNGPIPDEGVARLCEAAKVNGALMLHRFDHDRETTVNEETRTRTTDGEEEEYKIYTAEYSSHMHVSWRFRSCNGQTYDSYGYKVSDMWSAEGVTPGDAKSALGDTDDLDEQLSNKIGGQYFKRIAPHEASITRVPFAGPMGKKGKKFRLAVTHMKARKWKKAESLYLEIVEGLDDSEDGKLKGKAYYNLAIIYENMGKYDSMWYYANKADTFLGSGKSSGYLGLAEQRKNSEEKLKQQMEKAVQENPQDNR